MVEISIILPVYNGEKWINNCMNSIVLQSVLTFGLKIELIIFNDGSHDETESLLTRWDSYFNKRGIKCTVIHSPTTLGVGAAKNGAVKKSTGEYLCFQDIDDIMGKDRLLLQWLAAKSKCHNTLIGSKITRVPENSTPRFVSWANNLSTTQLVQRIYTSNGPTLLMPTWFCHRSVYDKVGGFDESGHGTPEDLLFFHSHLEAGGDLFRVDKELVVYTFHEGATTFSISREKIWRIQLQKLENQVLKFWTKFTVWNAGKAGRKLVRALQRHNLQKVVGFCDVDINKIGHVIELYCPVKRTVHIRLPVTHFTKADPPIVICVKLGLTNGSFERNLSLLNLIEGKDYIFFN